MNLASKCGRAGPHSAHAIAPLVCHTRAAGTHDRVRSPGVFAPLCFSSASRLELARAVGLVHRTMAVFLQRGKGRINHANNKPHDPAAYGQVAVFLLFGRRPPAGLVGTQRTCWRLGGGSEDPSIFGNFLKVALGVRWRVAIGTSRRSKSHGPGQNRMIESPRNGRPKVQNRQFTKRRACQPTPQVAPDRPSSCSHARNAFTMHADIMQRSMRFLQWRVFQKYSRRRVPCRWPLCWWSTAPAAAWHVPITSRHLTGRLSVEPSSCWRLLCRDGFPGMEDPWEHTKAFLITVVPTYSVDASFRVREHNVIVSF